MNEVRHRLGNLTLLLDSDNRDEAKKLLPTKKKKTGIYKTSVVRLTERLGAAIESGGWSAELAAEREEELVKMAEFVYQLTPDAVERAKTLETRRRRRAATAEVRTEPRVWWFTYGKGSPHSDVPGRQYQFGERLRAGKEVQTGDFAIEYKRTYSKRRRTWDRDEVIGIGRIGRVDEIVGVKRTENRQAIFSQYIAFDPRLLVSAMGVDDSRDRSQNSIKDASDQQFDALMTLAGLSAREEIPAVVDDEPSDTSAPVEGDATS